MTNNEKLEYIETLCASNGISKVLIGANGKPLMKPRFGTNENFLELSRGSFYVKGVPAIVADELASSQKSSGARLIKCDEVPEILSALALLIRLSEVSM